MTVYPLMRNAVFDPETIQVMAGAYEDLLGILQLADRNDPFTEVVAKEVIEVARLGVRDATEIRQRVLSTFDEPHEYGWHETAQLHRSPWRRGGVAAGGGRAQQGRKSKL